MHGRRFVAFFRELRNAIERAAILSPGDVIEPALLPGRPAGAHAVGPRVAGRAATLEEAARILGIDASTLWRKRWESDAPY